MENSSERDEWVMSVVARALQRPSTEREGYLRNTCGNDSQLYQEVAETIEWEARMGSFLLHPMIAFKHLARAFQVGQVISERFELIREIGEGGMGVVYEAFDRKRNQRIAIKAAKPGFQRLLSPELEGALKVRHPNICLVNQIHTTKTDNGEVDFRCLWGVWLSAYSRRLQRMPLTHLLRMIGKPLPHSTPSIRQPLKRTMQPPWIASWPTISCW